MGKDTNNTAVLFINELKRTSRDPDYFGKGKINEENVNLRGFVNESKHPDRKGKKYLKVYFDVIDDEGNVDTKKENIVADDSFLSLRNVNTTINGNC